MRCLILVRLFLASLSSFAQPSTPDGSLSPDFHRQRREALRNLLPPRSVAVLFASPIRNRANDVDYFYHQDPDLYYLTGFGETDAAFLLFKEPQTINGEQVSEALFVQPRNPMAEMWTGKRLGAEQAKVKHGIGYTAANTAFKDLPLNWQGFEQILFLPFQNDARDDARDEGDVFSLMQQFKAKAQIPADFDADKIAFYRSIRQTDASGSTALINDLTRSMMFQPHLAEDKLLLEYKNAPSEKAREKARKAVPVSKLDGSSLEEHLSVLREIKTPEEMAPLRKAIEMSAIGQIEVMKALKPGMSEVEAEGLHEFVYRKYNSHYEGYPSIVGAGNNGCVLHYTSNDKLNLQANELLLMDCGAEFGGYTADVTRTIPVGGKFTPEQKQIYELVYKAQEAGFQECKVGNPFNAPNQAAQKVIAAGLKELGIIKDEKEARRYFPHGTSHYLGLDVHDRGTYGPFKAGTVITVEPGIYIPEGSPCDKKWHGIGVRIEDDIFITEQGWENLSKTAPRTVADIEAMMTKPSALDDFKLPEIK